MPAEFETLRRVLVPARLSLSGPHRCWLEPGSLLQATLAKYLFHNPGSSTQVGCVFHRYGSSLGYCRNADARWSNTPAQSEIWLSRSLAKAVANSARSANLSPYDCVARVHRHTTAGAEESPASSRSGGCNKYEIVRISLMTWSNMLALSMSSSKLLLSIPEIRC